MKPAAALLAFAACFFATPTLAQTELGISGLELTLGHEGGDGGGSLAQAALDVAITEVHGLEGDLGLYQTRQGTLGTAAAHIYMRPREGRKYGLFAFAGDLDGVSATYGGSGFEGRYAVSKQTAVGAQAGLGLTHRTGFDFLFGSVELTHDLGQGLTFSAETYLADFDEAEFRATAVEARLGLDYRPDGQPWGLWADISHDTLSGHASETRISAGISVEFGTPRRGGLAGRPFGTPRPLKPLISRGLF